MKVLYYESEITEIVENITDYIQQTDSAEERGQYTEELAQVKDNFLNREEGGCPVWWEVLKMDDGVLWMNNLEGEMVFVEKCGRILKTLF